MPLFVFMVTSFRYVVLLFPRAGLPWGPSSVLPSLEPTHSGLFSRRYPFVTFCGSTRKSLQEEAGLTEAPTA